MASRVEQSPPAGDPDTVIVETAGEEQQQQARCYNVGHATGSSANMNALKACIATHAGTARRCAHAPRLLCKSYYSGSIDEPSPGLTEQTAAGDSDWLPPISL